MVGLYLVSKSAEFASVSRAGASGLASIAVDG